MHSFQFTRNTLSGELLEWEQLFLEAMLWRGGNFPGENFPRGQLSWGQFSSGAIFLGDNCPGGNYPGGNHPDGNYLWGNYPGAIFLAGNCPRTFFQKVKQIWNNFRLFYLTTYFWKNKNLKDLQWNHFFRLLFFPNRKATS